MRTRALIAVTGLTLAGTLASVPAGASAAPTSTHTQATTASAAAPGGVSPASIDPYEWDTAVSGTPPAFYDYECTAMTGATACFQRYGDKLWVEDTRADGHSATISWTNEQKDPDGNWWEVRAGSCVNKLGSGRWGVCNKDFYENDTPDNAVGGMGSVINFAACVYDASDGTWHGCTGYTQLYNNE